MVAKTLISSCRLKMALQKHFFFSLVFMTTGSPEILTFLLPQPYDHSILDSTLIFVLYKYTFTCPLTAHCQIHVRLLKWPYIHQPWRWQQHCLPYFGKLSTFYAAYSQKPKNANGIMFISWMFEWSNACVVLKVMDFLWRNCIMWQPGLCSLQDIIIIFLITICILSLILGTSLFTVCWYYFVLLYFTLYVLMLILLLRTWNVMSCIILRRLLLQ